MQKTRSKTKRTLKTRSNKLKEVQNDINDLRREVQDLARGFERLAFEVRRVSENEAQERKYMALQLENALLKFECRLPAGKPDPDERE